VLPSRLEFVERGESMSNKQRGMLAVFTMIIVASLITACTQSLSQAPAATPTLLPTGLFVSPMPSAENPMAMIEEFAKQTAAAQTAIAGGGTPAAPGTPGTPGTPQVNVTGTVLTPQTGITPTPNTTNVTPSTPTNANAVVPTTPAAPGLTPAAANVTPIPAGVKPSTYTLREGEFPYCIARRYNVDPDALIQASGLTNPDIYYAGLTLTIPQGGAFPGSRALVNHPTTYTVVSTGETVYSIACKFGDVDPQSIINSNPNIGSGSLNAGQTLNIP
jgi:LysM repeat protein